MYRRSVVNSLGHGTIDTVYLVWKVYHKVPFHLWKEYSNKDYQSSTSCIVLFRSCFECTVLIRLAVGVQWTEHEWKWSISQYIQVRLQYELRCFLYVECRILQICINGKLPATLITVLKGQQSNEYVQANMQKPMCTNTVCTLHRKCVCVLYSIITWKGI